MNIYTILIANNFYTISFIPFTIGFDFDFNVFF